MRQKYLDYLNSHRDIENIKFDSINEFGTTKLELLRDEDLQKLAEWWDFEEIKL